MGRKKGELTERQKEALAEIFGGKGSRDMGDWWRSIEHPEPARHPPTEQGEDDE